VFTLNLKEILTIITIMMIVVMTIMVVVIMIMMILIMIMIMSMIMVVVVVAMVMVARLILSRPLVFLRIKVQYGHILINKWMKKA